MLTKLRGAFGIKSKDEKDAFSIWEDGDMVVDWRTPKLGEKWDPRYLPHWRKWAGEKRAIEYSSYYRSIDDKEFWRRASSNFSQQESYLYALMDAAKCGNLAPFEVFETKHIAAYAQAFDVVRMNVRTNHGPVHPDVIEWMREKGHWNQSDVERLARNYLLERKSDRSHQVPCLTSGDERGATTQGFVFDWCTKSLRDNGWSADAQAQFLGNTMMNVSGHYWGDILPQLKRWLHPEVDVVMLAAVCGFSYKAEAFGGIGENPGVAQVYASVNAFVTNPQKKEAWMSSKSLPLQVMEWTVPNGHPGLNVLLELSQPGNAMEMYRLAMQVKNGELRGPTMEQVELPALGA